jgi:aryl-alcohol dehydrogenase-like predicted oxidoreductase
VPAWATAEAATIARFRGWAPIIALQLEYSLLERTAEGELIPMAQALGMAVMPWGPLKSGFLSGKYSSADTGPVDTTRTQLVGAPSEADYVVIDALHAVAREAGASPAAVALAWVQGRPGITSTLVGAPHGPVRGQPACPRRDAHRRPARRAGRGLDSRAELPGP